MLAALIFDLDGTLVDTNDMHVRAWEAALVAHGYRVARDRIAVEMGKGGDQFVPDLLGADAEAGDGDALRDAHDRELAKLAEREGILAFPGAQALLAAARDRGLRLALATSSGAKGLALTERTSGVPWRSLFDEVIDGDDVAKTKPAPDLVTAAVAALGGVRHDGNGGGSAHERGGRISAAECAMVGDTPWDARAAKHAGVATIAVTCGGNEPRALVRAGARAVLRDPAAILAALDDTLARVSPGSIRLTPIVLETLVRAALAAARDGMAEGEAPIGCVIARGDGEIVARGWNRLVRTGDRAAHAEIDAFRAAAGKLDPAARDTILVSTLEPCVMCLGAAMETAVDTVVYALRAPEDNGTSRVEPPTSPDNQMPRIVGPILAADSRALFTAWLARPDRDRAQEPFIRAVLART